MYKFSVVAILLTVGLSACSTGGVSTNTPDFQKKFSNGDIRLTCGVMCSASAGAAMQTQKQLYDKKLWKDLAQNVASIGMEGDLEYFYLGTAAFAQGYFNAARIYYSLSNAATYRCDGAFNNCQGFVFPRDTNIMMARISEQETQTATVKQRVSQQSVAKQAQPQTRPAISNISKNSSLSGNNNGLDFLFNQSGYWVEDVKPNQSCSAVIAQSSSSVIFKRYSSNQMEFFVRVGGKNPNANNKNLISTINTRASVQTQYTIIENSQNMRIKVSTTGRGGSIIEDLLELSPKNNTVVKYGQGQCLGCNEVQLVARQNFSRPEIMQWCSGDI